MKPEKLSVWKMETYLEPHYHVSAEPCDCDGAVYDLDGFVLEPGWAEDTLARTGLCQWGDGDVVDAETCAYAINTPQDWVSDISDTWKLRIEYHGPHTRIVYRPEKTAV